MDLCRLVRRVNIICALFVVYAVLAEKDYVTATCVLAFTVLMGEVRDVLTHAHFSSFELKPRIKHKLKNLE